MPKAVAVVSGGLDSTTLIYLLLDQRFDLQLLTFNYGQRHQKELGYAARIAERVNAPLHQIDLTSLLPLLSGSALTDPTVPVPEGHYADESMRATVVPNRNAIFLAIAYGVAVAQRADLVAIGVHAGDHPIYPDCRPDFLQAFSSMEQYATLGLRKTGLSLYAPFRDKKKGEIVLIGAGLGVPFALTWSCYKGEAVHCGRCGTCVERREAFLSAGISDPTVYLEHL